VSLVIGAFILFSNNVPALQISPGLIISVAFVIVAFHFLIIRAVMRARGEWLSQVSKGLVSEIGIAQTKLQPKGTILADGER
jgi:membrane-bound ClpP family serine protease